MAVSRNQLQSRIKEEMTTHFLHLRKHDQKNPKLTANEEDLVHICARAATVVFEEYVQELAADRAIRNFYEEED